MIAVAAPVQAPPAQVVPPAAAQLWRVDASGRLAIHPHPGQYRALTSPRRFIWMLAGTQGGKTSLQPLWLRAEMARRGPGDYLAVTSTFPLLKLKLLPEYLRLWQHTLALGEWRAVDRMFVLDRQRAAAHFGDPAFLAQDTRIIFGSANNAQSLESATALAATLDEAGQDDFQLAAWEAIQRRLALHEGRALAGTTLYNLGWLKQQVYDPWRAGDPDHDVIQFPSTLNPSFPQAEYDRAVRTMARWKVSMFFRGEYDRPAGLIYADYLDLPRAQGGHLVAPFPIPPEWPRHVGLDFGPVHTATLWLAHDPDANVYYLYHETLATEAAPTAEHAVAALRFARGTNVKTWHGGSASEDQQRAEWAAKGVPVLPPLVHDVDVGIDRVIALVKPSRLYVFDTCTGTRDELGSYSRELNEYGETTTKIKDKARYHRLDALRYVGQALGAFTAADLPASVPFVDKDAAGPGAEAALRARWLGPSVGQRWLAARSKERAKAWRDKGWTG